MWSFYDPLTGDFSGRTFSGSERLLEANTPKGLKPLPGRYDRLSQRVDKTGAVVDYQPPAPDADHEWRENAFQGRPRWVKKLDVVQREAMDAAARERLEEIDLAMVRPLAQLILDPQHAVARAALNELETEAAVLRADVVPTADEIERATRLREP